MRIYQCKGGGRRNGDLVMVEDDYIYAALLQPRDGVHRGRAAIHRQQQRGGEFFEAILDSLLAEAIALILSMRQIILNGPAKSLEHLEEQSGGGDAIYIVVAKNDD